jgi:nucleoside-diphosphate-sugar epimerase
MPVATVQRVVVRHPGSALGRRVVARLRSQGADVDVVGVVGVEAKAALQHADALVDLDARTPLATWLDAAGDTSVGHVVVASTAAVYGAWADNRVPLTEDLALRPNPGFVLAASAAERERLVAEWSDAHPGARAAVLRFAPILSAESEGEDPSAPASIGRPSLLRAADALPPVQALHVDDAASAVVHAVEQRLDGTFNVAPDGSVPGETARALTAAGIVPVGLPERVAWRAERWARRAGLGGVPRPAEPYRLHPWVVANDRLRATGWSPAYTSEEAIVACRKGSWWRELSPQRRQEVALGASGGLLLSALAAVVVAVRRARRRG